MASVSSKQTDVDKYVEQVLKELSDQIHDVERQSVMLAEIRESVKQYERRYGMSSNCVHEAIDAGELVEDQDVCHWIFQYNLLRRVEAK